MIVEKKEPGIEASEGTRCYTVPEMQKMLAQAGLEYIASYSDRHLDVPAQPLGTNVIREIIVGKRWPG
jgi:hypothetical protein